LLASGAKDTAGAIKDSALLAQECSSNIQKSLAAIDTIEIQISETAKIMGSSVNASREGLDKVKSDLDAFAQELLKTSAQHAASFDMYLQNVEKRASKIFQDLAVELKTQQKDITEDVESRYTDFSKNVAELMTDFGRQTQSQINDRLNEWNSQTSEYTRTMTDAIKALASVVDEIEVKVVRS